MTATVHTYSGDPDRLFERGGPLEGFHSVMSEGDYATDRASALYAALDVIPETDEEFVLGLLPDDRWALVGMDLESDRYAVEEPS